MTPLQTIASKLGLDPDLPPDNLRGDVYNALGLDSDILPLNEHYVVFIHEDTHGTCRVETQPTSKGREACRIRIDSPVLSEIDCEAICYLINADETEAWIGDDEEPYGAWCVPHVARLETDLAIEAPR